MKRMTEILLISIIIVIIASCTDDNLKPVSRFSLYPTLLGTWQWDCFDNSDTEGRARPFSDRATREFGDNGDYTLEIITYKGADCAEDSAVSKSIYTGTYTTEVQFDSANAEYVKIDYSVTSRSFEGNSLIAATAVSAELLEDSFTCAGVGRVDEAAGTLEIDWASGMVNSGLGVLVDTVYEDNGALCPYGPLDETLTKIQSIPPLNLPDVVYSTDSLSQLVGKWTEGCDHLADTDTNTGTDYYRKTIYEIGEVAEIPTTYKYTQTVGLHENDPSCNNVAVSTYTFPAVLKINTAIGDENNGVGPSNIPGVSGLHVLYTFETPIPNLAVTTGTVVLEDHSHDYTANEIMVVDESGDYLFVYGGHTDTLTNTLKYVYLKEPFGSPG